MLTLTPQTCGQIYDRSLRIIDGVSFDDYRPIESKLSVEIDRNSFVHFIDETYPELTKSIDRQSVLFHNHSAGVLISIGTFSPKAYSVQFSRLANPINETWSFTGNDLSELKTAAIYFLTVHLPLTAEGQLSV
jgi:hypothetical protein